MPGPLHQGLVYLLNKNPHLVFDLAHRFDAKFGTSWVSFEAASNELPDPAHEGNILHADGVHAALAHAPGAAPDTAPIRVGGVAVEVQTCRDLLKLYSWLSHAAGVRRLFQCRGWTMVFAPDEDVRRYYQGLFADERRACPWLVDPGLLSPIVELRHAARDVAKALLTVVFHARLIHAVASARATLEALRNSPLDLDEQRVYTQLVRSSLKDEQVRRLPKELLQWDDDWEMGPMEMTSAYYTRGLAAGRQEGIQEGRQKGRQKGIQEGRQEGIQEGRQEGRVLEARRLLFQVLEHRGVRLNQAQHARIQGCTDPQQLESWLDRALGAVDAAALFT